MRYNPLSRPADTMGADKELVWKPEKLSVQKL
jgi:hypothetical protein